MLVLLGMATYSYKRVAEVVEHNLYNAISGRSTTRVLAESYIMMKYLLDKEIQNDNIWAEFQEYGMGQYKIIVARARDYQINEASHVEYKLLEILVEEHAREEFMDMDTSYFDKQNIREKANLVDEKELYGLYYDYDSAFEHGLWGCYKGK